MKKIEREGERAKAFFIRSPWTALRLNTVVIPSGWRDIYMCIWLKLAVGCVFAWWELKFEAVVLNFLTKIVSLCLFMRHNLLPVVRDSGVSPHVSGALQRATERPSHLSTTNPNVPETWEPITTTLFQQTPPIPKQDHYKYQLLIPHGPPPWLTVQISFINGQCRCQCKSSFWCRAILSL